MLRLAIAAGLALAGALVYRDIAQHVDPLTQYQPVDPFGVDPMTAHNNVEAFVDTIIAVEAGGRYDVIAGFPTYPDARFSDFSEHPYVLDPTREKYVGTTASGGGQFVKRTWIEARDALGLQDFSPVSQRAAIVFLIKRRGALADVEAGRFDAAIGKLQLEWEAFARMLNDSYPITVADAQAIYETNGGNFA